jgi:hypothetical protein
MKNNLGKENFWNPMREKFPLAVEAFCKWIDEYKKIVDWENVIGAKVKFHDLPYEMQMGIMNRYFIEMFASKEEYDLGGERIKAYHAEMEEAICELEHRMKKSIKAKA